MACFDRRAHPRTSLSQLRFWVRPFLAIEDLYEERFHEPRTALVIMRRDLDKPGNIISPGIDLAPAVFDSPFLQRKRYLFVCINRRDEGNPKGSCAVKDSDEVYRALKEELAARGLAKLEARVCTSSCLDECATGVTVLVEPDHFFYGHVTVADVREIVDGLINNQSVQRLVITDDHCSGGL